MDTAYLFEKPIMTKKGRLPAIEPNVSRCLQTWKDSPDGWQPTFLVHDTLALPQLSEIRAFEKRFFNFYSEIVVTFVAD